MTELVPPQAVLDVRIVLQPARPPAIEMVYPPAVTVNTQRCRPLLSSCSMDWHLATHPARMSACNSLQMPYWLIKQAA